MAANWFLSLMGIGGANIADVDEDHQLLVKANQDPAKAGAARMYDSDGHAIVVEENGALSVSQDNLIFSEQVDGSALNTNKWISSVSVLAIAQAAGYINLNSAASSSAGYAILTSILNIPFYGDLPIEVSVSAKISVLPQAGATVELGIGLAAANAAPTDGAFFRWAPTGAFQAVVNNSGSETTAVIAAPSANAKHRFSWIVAEDHVQFVLDDEIVADIENPSALSYPFNAGRQPLLARVVVGASPAQPPVLSIGQVTVVQLSINQFRPWQHVLADMGLSAYQSPVTPFTQATNRANSSAAASLSLSNTVASLTTLGGEWQVAAPAGAATDYALFAFQVPAGFRLKVFGVRINAGVMGAAVVTAAVLDWALGINSSAASLATAESPPASWAPRRITLGSQGFPALSGIATMAPDILQRFEAPLVVDSGRFFHIILRIPGGAATAGLLYRGSVLIDGQYE